MDKFASSYVHIRTAFGFKKFICDETTLLKFINSVIPVQVTKLQNVTQVSVSVPYSTATVPEHLQKYDYRNLPGDTSMRFDVVCVTSNNELVHVEIQLAKNLEHFYRALYYSSRLISRQTAKENDPQERAKAEAEGRMVRYWNWDLRPTYHISILDFPISKINHIPESAHNCWKVWISHSLRGAQCSPTIENDLLNSQVGEMCIISLETFHDQMTTQSCNTDLERFLWLLSYLGGGRISLPDWAHEDRFKIILQNLSLSNLSSREFSAYELSLDQLRDENEANLSYYLIGLREGFKEGKELGYKEGKELGYKEGKELRGKEGKELGLK